MSTVDERPRTGVAGGPGGRRRPPLLVSLVREARPKQWAKNVLVAAAPGAAGVLSHGHVLTRTAVAFAAFCLVASGNYYLNDARDAEADRRHPVKSLRPLASGAIPMGVGVAVGLALFVGGFAVAFTLGWKFAGVVAIYVGLTPAYS